MECAHRCLRAWDPHVAGMLAAGSSARMSVLIPGRRNVSSWKQTEVRAYCSEEAPGDSDGAAGDLALKIAIRGWVTRLA